MVHMIKHLYDDKLAAIDGEIGHVKDFYFDDESWAIRYLVADTGSWLTGRLVLLTPHTFGEINQEEKTFHIKLHKKQIENSPAIESHKPVSRQFEIEYLRLLRLAAVLGRRRHVWHRSDPCRTAAVGGPDRISPKT